MATALLCAHVRATPLKIVTETVYNQGMEGGANNVIDSDHDGAAELLYTTVFPGIRRQGLGFYKWISADSIDYFWGDTTTGACQGIDTAELRPFAAGHVDRDSLSDLAGGNSEYTQTNGYLLVCQYESPSYHANPTKLVWYDRFDTNCAWSGGRMHLADLDRDSRNDLLFMTLSSRVLVYENLGDNLCQLVSRTAARGEDLSMFAIGDLDQDSLTEFAAGAVAWNQWIWFWECAGNDTYVLTDSIPTHWPNAHDIWEGHDTDQDGKPEFFVAFARLTGGYWMMYLYQIEATGDNQHDAVFVDSAWCSSIDWERQSRCGDVDGDGIEEIVWSTGTHIHIYKGVGPRQYERVYSWENPAGCFSDVAVYDINKDGYKEFIVSGHVAGGGSRTRVFGLEAAKVVYPNGGEVFSPGDTVQMLWRRFEPPRCDSASLSLSIDRGRTWQPLVSGLAPDDSVVPWVVPRLPSDSCLIRVVVYGPGWRADRSDNEFRVLPIGVEEEPDGPAFGPALVICPSPSCGSVSFSYRVPSAAGSSLRLYDATGRQVADLSSELTNTRGRLHWHLRDSNGRSLSAGVYLARLVFGPRIVESKLAVR